MKRWANVAYFLLYVSGVYGLLLWPPIAAMVTTIAGPLHRLIAHDVERVPLAVRCIGAFIGFDCLAYWMHRAAHRNALLWRFHRTHHSDDALGPLTTFRFHIVEIAWRMAVQFLPLYLLGVTIEIPNGVVLALASFNMLAHSATGWTYGLFGRGVVSPAYHEVHHRHDEHANFSMYLVVWDTWFGTQSSPSPAAGGRGSG